LDHSVDKTNYLSSRSGNRVASWVYQRLGRGLGCISICLTLVSVCVFRYSFADRRFVSIRGPYRVNNKIDKCNSVALIYK